MNIKGDAYKGLSHSHVECASVAMLWSSYVCIFVIPQIEIDDPPISRLCDPHICRIKPHR